MCHTYLIKGNTQALHAHSGLRLAVRSELPLFALALGDLLHPVLALDLLAEGDDDQVLRVERRHHLLPVVDDETVLGKRLLRLLVHVLLDLLEQGRDLRRELGNGDCPLGAGIAACVADHRLLHVLGAEFQPQGNTLHLPLCELEAGGTGCRLVTIHKDLPRKIKGS